MADPSSLQTMPSGITIRSATSQPSIACGPPRAVISRGIVMNGPTPIMFVMLRAVACRSPNLRRSAVSELIDPGESTTGHGPRKNTEEHVYDCQVECAIRQVLVVQSGTLGV